MHTQLCDAACYMKQMLLDFKGERNSSALIREGFITHWKNII